MQLCCCCMSCGVFWKKKFRVQQVPGVTYIRKACLVYCNDKKSLHILISLYLFFLIFCDACCRCVLHTWWVPDGSWGDPWITV